MSETRSALFKPQMFQLQDTGVIKRNYVSRLIAATNAAIMRATGTHSKEEKCNLQPTYHIFSYNKTSQVFSDAVSAIQLLLIGIFDCKCDA